MAEENIGKKVGDEVEDTVYAVEDALTGSDRKKDAQENMNSINPNEMTERQIDEKIQELKEQYELTDDKDEKKGIMDEIGKLEDAKKQMKEGKNGIMNALGIGKDTPEKEGMEL